MQDLHRPQKKIVIATAGLPARGKTHIAHKLNRYLNWVGYKSRVFSVAQVMKVQQGGDFDPEIYDPDNEKAIRLREEYSLLALEELIRFMKKEGDVAIFNATNATKVIRTKVQQFIVDSLQSCEVFWVESICNKPNVILKNIQSTKLDCEQYRGLQREEAQQDFLRKIEQMAKRYEEIDNEKSYIKVIDIGEEILIHQIDGYLQSKIVSFLMNLHINERPIYFCRHGETFYSQIHRVGGDAELTDKGIRTAENLANFFKKEFQNKRDIKIFSSTMKRAKNTAELIGNAINTPVLAVKTLDELDYGVADGLTYPEIIQKYPERIKEREKDKLRFRFPRGESYLDVISRIEPVIFEIERYRRPVVVVGHTDTIRCLYGYFHHNSIEEIPKLEVPENTIIKLVPGSTQQGEIRFKLDQETGEILTSNEK